jgi:hypothetical protein
VPEISEISINSMWKNGNVREQIVDFSFFGVKAAESLRYK